MVGQSLCTPPSQPLSFFPFPPPSLCPQPRFAIFQRFDSLLLLSEGTLVYQGPASLARAYFERTCGYVCEAYNSPPDFFLDIISDDKARHGTDKGDATAM